VLKFYIIFHDPTPKNVFSKHENKAEFKCLDDSEVLSSDFPGLNDLDSLISLKKFTDPDDLIVPSTQMTNTSPFLWN